MRSLIDFIKRYYYWAVFITLEILSITMLLRWANYQRSLWFAAVTEVTGHVHEKSDDLLRYLSLGQENALLTERNIILEKRIESLTRTISRLTHDTTYAERVIMATAKGDSAHLIPAKIVGARMQRRDNFIMINKGEADGVRTEMGVICGTGVVGIVYHTSPHFSIIMPVLHSKSSISCRLRGSGYFGYLRWEGGDTQTAVVDDIPRHAYVNPGDIVETSGFSAVFPAGLFVGRVAKAENSDDGLSYTLHVRLGVDFGRLRDVMIVADNRHEEMKELENAD